MIETDHHHHQLHFTTHTLVKVIENWKCTLCLEGILISTALQNGIRMKLKHLLISINVKCCNIRCGKYVISISRSNEWL